MLQRVMGKNKLRSLFSIVLVFSLLLSSFQSIAFADDQTLLEIGTISGDPGDIVDVPVYIYPGDYSIYGYQINFNYNFNKLEPVTEVATSKWSTTNFNAGLTPGSSEVYVQASFGEEHPIVNGKQEVFVLHFKIKETASEGSAHVIRSSGNFMKSDGNTILIERDTPGSVTINSNQGSGSGGTEPTEAQSPQITQEPLDKEVNLNDMSPTLSVTATVSDGGNLTYQWYRNTKKSVESGVIEKIEGATQSSYDVPTSTVGTTYYFVEVKNTIGSRFKITPSTVATVVVNPLVEGGNWIDITGSERPVFSPVDIAVDPNGTVYVASSTQIKMRSGNGNWVDITPQEGLNYVSGMAADSNGSIYVSRSRSSSILKYTDGAWEIVGGTGLSTPVDVAISEQNQIFVADAEYSRVSTLVGGYWGSISNIPVYNPVGLAVIGENRYVTDADNRVLKLTYDSWEDITAGVAFNMPKGIAADADGDVYVADYNNQIVRKLSDGVWTTISTSDDFIGPYGVAVDFGGNVYVVDNENGHIKKLIANAEEPVIHAQPIGSTVDQGAESPKLSIHATVNDGGTLSYQWYSNTTNSIDNATLIEGATGSNYSVPTTQSGKLYYFVKVKNTNLAARNQTATVNSDVVSVTVNPVQLPAYSVTFDRQDGSNPFSMGVTQGSKIPGIIVSERPGYTFEGWYKDAAGTTKWNIETDVVTDDVILYAKWTATTNSGGNGGGNAGGGTGTGNAGGNNSGTTGGANGSSTTSNNDAVIVLVNGKEERIGKSVASTEGERTVTTITIDPQQLDTKLKAEGQGAVVTIPVSAESNIIVGELTGQMVKNMEEKQAVLVVKTGNASYTLPAQQLDINSISKQLGTAVTLEDIKIQIRIASPEAAMLKVAEDAAEKNALSLVAPSFDFTVKATFADHTVDVTKFNVYVERSIALPEGIDLNKITTGIVTDRDGSVRHVPTKVTEEDGQFYAKINSLTNSLYSVVWHPLMFKDVENHWAKDAVNDMGSRLIVNGIGNDLYNPNTDMTRAEFAAIMMKGLGLKPVDGKAPFADVDASDWYHSAVLTTYEYNLIEGFEDGNFRPQEKITREQAMVILFKAMAITGLQEKLETKDSDEMLKPYTDAIAVSEWAKAAVAASIEAGVISGRGAHELAAKANITRAEVAAIVQRILKASDLI
ncbi:S-layer homology domain-containing protein [Paenibacillus xylanexedens]|uniref:S-layer homology domain-containing protein n=1 Tax=Paenibacillus xylanexedens TaxID=528191 RepID=UPI00119F27FF|nr:S-layer homology domain-containing protein [Paenibacillus xylanexedens]